MAIIATGQKTIIDLSDGKSLSVYLGSNLPRTQIYDGNVGSYSPDWTVDNLEITPVVYANQTRINITDSALSISWKKREGANSEVDMTSSSKVLTINTNVLGSSTNSSGLISYVAYVTYVDPDTKLPINATADITFALVKTGQNAKSVWISGDQVFKYDTEGNVGPSQIVLTANLQNVGFKKWQYKNTDGEWVDYPTTNDNANITSSTLIVKPSHNIWNSTGDQASIKALTQDDAISDSTSIYKVVDGVGTPGEPGEDASIAFLTNENITFAGNVSGQVAGTTVTCNVVAYTGTTKKTPTVNVNGIEGTIANQLTVTQGSTTNSEVQLIITVANNSTLGGNGEQHGTITIPVTYPVNTTLIINWSKVNTGQTGEAGANAIVFSLYAPDGSVFVNGEGTLKIQSAAYEGSTPITSGATYKWEKYSSGSWSTVSGTSSSLSVAGSSVVGTATYRCTMTYGGKTYTDVITLTDKTDNYQATIESSGGEIFKNSVGSSTLVCRLFQNGAEVDEAGTSHTYTWYRLDKDGNPMDNGSAFATGKSIEVDGDDVEVKTTFTCEVSSK